MESISPIPLTFWDHVINAGFSCLMKVVNPVLAIVGVCLLVLGFFFNIRYYDLSLDNMRKYQSKAIHHTMVSPNGKPAGVVFGFWFIGFSKNPERGPSTMSVLATISTHSSICGVEDTTVSRTSKKPEIPTTFLNWGKCGSYSDLLYPANKVGVTPKQPKEFQRRIVSVIADVYDIKKSVAVMISGPPGCGKSSIGRQLIRYFSTERKQKCHYTDEFSPTEPSNLFQSLYNDVAPVDDNPFIVLIDEADGILNRISGSGVPPHSKFMIQIKNKTEWNTFFDKVDEGRWKNTIFILTSNLSLDALDSTFDRSFLRPGRMDCRFEVFSDGNFRQQVPSENRLKWI